jgi:hypothetical protein
MKASLACVFLFACIAVEALGQTGSANSNEMPEAAKQMVKQEVSRPASNPSGGGSVLEDGTPVKLRLTRNVSSADARVGGHR